MAGRRRWHGWVSSPSPQGLTQDRLLSAAFPSLGYLLLSGKLAHQLLAHQEQFA